MVPHIRHLSERRNARQGFFADYEVRAVVEKLPTYLQDFARFGYLTGWRRGEIASLRWEDVDGDLIRLRGENAKNGETRSITPLTDKHPGSRKPLHAGVLGMSDEPHPETVKNASFSGDAGIGLASIFPA